MLIRSKKIVVVLLILFVAIGAMSGMILRVNAINKSDAKRQKIYEDAATPVGLARAKEECVKEGIGDKICDTMTGDTSSTECGGKTCWITYAHTDDPYKFGASITIVKQGNKYNISKYLRNTVERP